VFDEDLIHGSSIQVRRSAERYRAGFKLRLPWYRSLHLSSVERIDVRVDGKAIDAADVSLTLYGKTYPFPDLVTLHDVLWFVLDVAELDMWVDAPPSGRTCEVSATLFIRIPYRRSSGFREIGMCAKTLNVALEQ
jgi:hypothetical protein